MQKLNSWAMYACAVMITVLFSQLVFFGLVIAEDQVEIFGGDENILECSPESQTVSVGETASFSVTALVNGQDRYYIWDAEDGTPSQAEGQGLDEFETVFEEAGEYEVKVYSLYYGNDKSTCKVKVEEKEPTPPQCDDNIDNADPEDTLVDEADPGCHSDGNAENSESYVPTDNDETNSGGGGGGGDDKPECSDDVDNNDPEDTLVDENDPGCHTDEDPNNTASYDANDDNETNTDGTGGGETECADGVDNTDPEDTLIDEEDPGCHTDNDAEDGDDTYNPDDNNEVDEEEEDNGGGGGGSSSSRSSGSRRNNSTGQVLGAETSCGIYVDKYLRVGHANDTATVMKIQNFLNFYVESNLEIDGIYGPATAAAVSKFQAMHADNVLDPWGIDEPTGIFYLTTQTEVNNILCPDLNLDIPNPLINWSLNPYVVLPPAIIA